MSIAKLDNWPDKTLIKITGPDRLTFLQGLVTQDVTTLADQKILYACMLSSQGRFEYDFILIEAGESILLVCDSSFAEPLLKKIRFFTLRAQVFFEVLEDKKIIHTISKEQLKSQKDVFLDPRHPALGYIQIVEHKGVETAFSYKDFEILRIQHAIPEGQKDMTFGKSIILENNFEEAHAISWDKGCYMGQELIARVKHQGLVRKRLVPIYSPDAQYVFNASLYFEGNVIGKIKSFLGSWGLALCRVEAIQKSLETKSPVTTQEGLPIVFNLEKAICRAAIFSS